MPFSPYLRLNNTLSPIDDNADGIGIPGGQKAIGGVNILKGKAMRDQGLDGDAPILDQAKRGALFFVLRPPAGRGGKPIGGAEMGADEREPALMHLLVKVKGLGCAARTA